MNDIERIAENYGLTHQLIKLCEECGELVQAICKYELYNDIYYDNIVEEIADVEIMTSQIKYFLTAENEVEHIKKKKIKRQIERIERNDE